MAIEDKANTTPIFSPGAPTDLLTAIKNFESSIRMKLKVCVPVSVYEYDRKKQVVTVIPLTKFAYRNDTIQFVRRQPFTVSVHRIIHGGFALDIPLFKGDTGWVIASDRDTMKIKTEGELTTTILQDDRDQKVLEDEYEQEPQYSDFHFLQEGFFIPDSWGSFELDRCKDLEEEVPDDALYIGTAFDTTDKYQKKQEYERKDSCSVVMRRNGGITIANSLPSQGDKNHKSIISLDKGNIEIKAINNQKDENSVDITLKHEDGSCVIKNGKGVSIRIDSSGEISLEGTTINLSGNVMMLDKKVGLMEIEPNVFIYSAESQG